MILRRSKSRSVRSVATERKGALTSCFQQLPRDSFGLLGRRRATAEVIEVVVADFTIRALDRRNAAEYRLLRQDALEHYPASFATSRAEWAKMSLKKVEEMVCPSDGSVVLGAFHSERSLGDVLIGIGGLKRQDKEKYRHKAMIWGMYVDPEWRGKGIARSLLEELIAHARVQAELQQVLLTVTEGNARAQALYERLGFRVYGIEPKAIEPGDGVYRDEVLMALDLRA